MHIINKCLFEKYRDILNLSTWPVFSPCAMISGKMSHYRGHSIHVLFFDFWLVTMLKKKKTNRGRDQRVIDEADDGLTKTGFVCFEKSDKKCDVLRCLFRSKIKICIDKSYDTFALVLNNFILGRLSELHKCELNTEFIKAESLRAQVNRLTVLSAYQHSTSFWQRLEALINSKMVKHLTQQDLLSDKQYGYQFIKSAGDGPTIIAERVCQA